MSEVSVLAPYLYEYAVVDFVKLKKRRLLYYHNFTRNTTHEGWKHAVISSLVIKSVCDEILFIKVGFTPEQ